MLQLRELLLGNWVCVCVSLFIYERESISISFIYKFDMQQLTTSLRVSRDFSVIMSEYTQWFIKHISCLCVNIHVFLLGLSNISLVMRD
jgi:hypothetical protein